MPGVRANSSSLRPWSASVMAGSGLSLGVVHVLRLLDLDDFELTEDGAAALVLLATSQVGQHGIALSRYTRLSEETVDRITSRLRANNVLVEHRPYFIHLDDSDGEELFKMHAAIGSGRLIGLPSRLIDGVLHVATASAWQLVEEE